MQKGRWRDIKQGRIAPPSMPSSSPCGTPASYFTRFKAQVVDTFMLYTPILYLVTYVILGRAEEFRSNEWGPFLSVTLYGILSSILLALHGQTPGCKAYNIRVVDREGRKIGFLRALGRFFLFLLSALLLFGIALPFIRQKRSTLHDWILDTSVINGDASSSVD